MIYIQYCLSDGNDENTEIYYAEYADNTSNQKFKSALKWMINHFYDKHCPDEDEDDEYFWKCMQNSYYCGVTKEIYDDVWEDD